MNSQLQTPETIDNRVADRPERYEPARDVPVRLLGSQAEWFAVTREGTALLIQPVKPLPRRCVVRVAALFQHTAPASRPTSAAIRSRGFPDLNTVMGKLLFAPGSTQPQRYEPFTFDPDRRFRELFLLVEASPDDELFSSPGRWGNYETVAKRLLDAADIPWNGLSNRDLSELAGDEPWLIPLEGCVLHALAQHSQTAGSFAIEIGSLRGQSLAMIARGLRCSGSDKPLISIDPHGDEPINRETVRQALSRIDKDNCLIQCQYSSDDAAGLFAPDSAFFIFIDGDHSHRQVVADFQNYAPLLAPGGYLAFHDYGYGPHNGRPDVVPDVRPAINECVMPHDDFEPVLLAHTLIVFRKRASMGIGKTE